MKISELREQVEGLDQDAFFELVLATEADGMLSEEADPEEDDEWPTERLRYHAAVVRSFLRALESQEEKAA